MTDNQRDELLSDLRESVARLATALPLMQERVLEKLQVLDESQRELFRQSGACKKRLGALEGWQREVSSLGSARSSAFTKWMAVFGLGFAALSGICGGIFSLIHWASG